MREDVGMWGERWSTGRRSCSVICEAVMADRSGTGVHRWCLDVRNRTKPCVFSHKVAPGVYVGNLVCVTGPAFTRLRSNAFSLVKLNSGEHCDGCIHLVDCRGGGRSCSVICEAVMADRSGTGVHRWCLDVRNRTKPCVFSHKVAPGVYVGNLVCATGMRSLL